MILTKCFGVGVSCRNLYSFVVYLYVNGSRVGKCDEVIKDSAPMFSSFSQWFAEFMQ